jgi:hypothetical protein
MRTQLQFCPKRYSTVRLLAPRPQSDFSNARAGRWSLVTGFSGRVDSNSNFTDVAVYCSTMSSGLWAGSRTSVPNPVGLEEKQLLAADGFAIVGIGGIVSNNNLARIVAWQCQWDSTTHALRFDTAGLHCGWASTDGVNSTEKFLSSHAGGDNSFPKDSYTKPAPSDFERSHAALRGIGMTASNDNLAGIRAVVATF